MIGLGDARDDVSNGATLGNLENAMGGFQGLAPSLLTPLFASDPDCSFIAVVHLMGDKAQPPWAGPRHKPVPSCNSGAFKLNHLDLLASAVLAWLSAPGMPTEHLRNVRGICPMP